MEEINISVSLGENPCLHIENSYLLTSENLIKHVLEMIHETQMYEDLKKAGYNRTLESEYREWRAHNFLYEIGYERERTKHVDIDQNESGLRKFIYAILSIF